MTKSTALTAPVQSGAVEVRPERQVYLRPVIDVDEAITEHKRMTEIITKALEEKRDYGTVPGTKDRMTLYKAGAERLAKIFGLVPTFEIVEKEVDHFRPVDYSYYTKREGRKSGTAHGYYRYVIRCDLIHALSGAIVGYGYGSCSTLESKYVSRPRESENTVLKMSKKRAFVDSVLTALALSDRFTQDMEDMAVEDEAVPEVEEAPAPRARPKDAEPQDDPRDVVIPLGPDAGKALRGVSAKAVRAFKKYMKDNPEVAKEYPVFADAIEAVFAIHAEQAKVADTKQHEEEVARSEAAPASEPTDDIPF